MHTDLWPACGGAHLEADHQGGLVPTPAYWQTWLKRPELCLMAESCRAETALHQLLQADPLRTVAERELAPIKDPDVRDNYRHFLALRTGLQNAGSLQAWLMALWRTGNQGTPPVFIEQVVQAVVRHMLMAEPAADAFTTRAAELLFREQRISDHQGRRYAGDRATLDLQHETHGFGDLGRLLAQAKQPLRALHMQVLRAENAAAYWAEASRSGPARHSFLLDLTHSVKQDLGHQLVFTLTQAHSGLQGLAEVLQRWVRQLLGVNVRITPLDKVDDPHWRWHVGLDVEATALLNDLYEDRPVDADRMKRLISLFRLDFADAQDMAPAVAGCPVYLALMADPHGLLRLKPHNLLLNLPLAERN
jgi:hypothetical protein